MQRLTRCYAPQTLLPDNEFAVLKSQPSLPDYSPQVRALVDGNHGVTGLVQMLKSTDLKVRCGFVFLKLCAEKLCCCLSVTYILALAKT